MYAILHMGDFDGAEFDMRPWGRVPQVVFARRGGSGALGLVLSRSLKPGSTRYKFVSAVEDEHHYLLADEDVGDMLLAEIQEPVAA